MSDNYKFVISGTDKTRKMFTSLRNNVRGVGRAMSGTTARIGALVGVAGMGAMVASTLKSVDTLAKLSDRLNISTEDLSAFHHMAELNGTSSEVLDKSLAKMVRSIGEAERGFGTGKKALDQMNISVKDLDGKSASEQYQIIADGIKGLKNSTQKASVASDIFGRSGADLMNTINQGSEGFRSAKEEVDLYGLSISRIDAAKIEEANDSILRAKSAVSGMATKATVELAPIITEITSRFTQAATQGEGMGGAIKSAFSGGAKVVGMFADGIRGIKVILKGAEIVGRGFGAAFIGTFNLITMGAYALGNTIKNTVLAPMRSTLELAAEFSDSAQEALDTFNSFTSDFKAPEGINNLYNSMVDGVRVAKGEIHDMMMEPLPSAVIKANIDDILASAEVRATETVKKIKENMNSGTNDITDDPEAEKAKEKALKDKAKLEETEAKAKKKRLDDALNADVSRSKKLTAIQDAARIKMQIAEKASQLKIAAGDGYVAIQKAWASAPFPYNLGAVASATLNAGANLAAIGGLEHGGPVGNRSIVEVGERNKPEVLSWGGKNFLLGGNGGAVFNTSQLNQNSGNSATQVIVNLIEDASKAGQVDQRSNGGQTEIDAFVSDIRGGDERSQILEQTYGLSRGGV